MSVHSTAKPDSVDEEETPDSESSSIRTPDVPLAELPLVADAQQTAIIQPNQDGAGETGLIPADVPVETLFLQNDSASGAPPGRLAHYEVRRRIGAGGMGVVFLAEDLELRRPVALKVLHPSAATDPSLLTRFRNEARAAAMLGHDNIAQVYFIGEARGVHFIAFEYVEGRTFRDLIHEQGTVAADDVINYAIQITLALNHLYANGVVHRDIKPSNLILTDDGRVKIVDLGLARRDSPDSVCDITADGSTLGTFDYLAPEQARDPRSADIRSDIYSLGCTMFHLLAGQPPYPDRTALQKMLDHQGKSPPDPAQINPGIPRDVADVVQTMMSTNPDERYQTPAELLSELMDIAIDIGLTGVPADGIVWQNPRPQPLRAVSGSLFLAGAVALICLTAIILHLLPQKSSDSGFLTTPGLTIRPAGQDIDGGNRVPDKLNQDSLTGEARDELQQRIERSEDLLIAALFSGSASPALLPAWHTIDEAETRAEPESDPARRFLVTSTDGVLSHHRTLSEALSVARAGSIIELAWDGLLPKPLPPLSRLTQPNVRLKAAHGFAPVLEFRGSANDVEAASMFTLTSNASLSIEGITLRLAPDPNSIPSQWVVFDCMGPCQIDVRNCAIDIASQSNADVSVCRLQEPSPGSEGDETTDIRFSDVIVRGRADGFRIMSQAAIDLELRNCGFGLHGRLIDNMGSTATSAGGRVNVRMEHVTCLGTDAIIGFRGSELADSRRTLPAMTVTAQACLFASLKPNGVLVESRGWPRTFVQRELLSWNGSTNLYTGFPLYWKIRSGTSDYEDTFDREDWENHWRRPQAEGSEQNAAEFVWNDAAWPMSDDRDFLSPDFAFLNRSWFTLSSERFYNRGELPLYKGREIPGVDVLQLPEFPRL